jgi:hypothetical protein
MKYGYPIQPKRIGKKCIAEQASSYSKMEKYAPLIA